MHLVGRQMDVIAVEDLGHDTPLRGHSPSASAQSFQEVTHAGQLNSKVTRSRMGVTLDECLN
jgi:hypothetical protein